jgi:phosphoribosylaminoimidazole (AIR) synthetase
MGTSRAEMLRVFNMGIGFVFFVRPYFAPGVMRVLRRAGEHPLRLGRVRRGQQRVRFS